MTLPVLYVPCVPCVLCVPCVPRVPLPGQSPGKRLSTGSAQLASNGVLRRFEVPFVSEMKDLLRLVSGADKRTYPTLSQLSVNGQT